MVGAEELGLHVSNAAVREGYVERWMPLDGGFQPCRKQESARRFGALQAFVGAEAKDTGFGAGLHGRNPGIIRVQDRCAGRRQGFDQFTLGDSDVFDRPELPRMRRSDAQYDADVRLDHLGEVADVSDAGGSHLDDEVTGGEIRRKNCQRNPNLSVVRSDRRHRRRFASQNSGQQILGGRFPSGTGNSDHGQRTGSTQPFHHGAGEGSHGEDGVVDYNRRIPGTRGAGHRALSQRQHGPGVERLADKAVPVRLFARLGHIK